MSLDRAVIEDHDINENQEKEIKSVSIESSDVLESNPPIFLYDARVTFTDGSQHLLRHISMIETAEKYKNYLDEASQKLVADVLREQEAEAEIDADPSIEEETIASQQPAVENTPHSSVMPTLSNHPAAFVNRNRPQQPAENNAVVETKQRRSMSM